MDVAPLERMLAHVGGLAGSDSRVLTRDPGEVVSAGALGAARLVVVEEGLVVVRGGRTPDWRLVVKRFAGGGSILLPPAADESIGVLAAARVRTLSERAVTRLVSDESAALFLLGGLEASLRSTDETLGALAHVHHVDRVRDLLLQLARAHGRVDRNAGVRIDLPLTHELVAQAVASARETVSRAIEALERDGFVTRDGGGVYRVLVPPETL